MEISFEQLNAFQAVAQTLSFSKAAEKIFRTQSAVSIQVARLEETIGQKLFQRSTKRIELTEAGEILMRYTAQIKALLEQAGQELIDLKKMAMGRLTICTSDTTACYRLPRLIQSFQTKYPGIEIIVRNATSLKTIDLVMDNQVDLGISTLKYLKPPLVTVPLFYRADVLICHPQHPLAGRKTIYLKDLEAYTCVLLDQKCSSRRILDEACQAAGVTLSIAMELSSIEVVKNFVSINSGISIVPEVAVKKEVFEQRLVAMKIKDFSDKHPIKMGAIYKEGRYLSLAAGSFLTMLKTAYKTNSL
ncbi:MAG: LysR family transcriptional regulator [Desulfobacteraceae bacterium]|nr:MAG: LysR family transcriptional regulator [Desulfobacteraceae bacterium]